MKCASRDGTRARIKTYRQHTRYSGQRRDVSYHQCLAMPSLLEQFGNIDIYLFDQILRGRISRGMTVLDAGCGNGRNLIYLLRSGYQVFGTDTDPAALDVTRRLAASLSPDLPA